MSNLTDSIKELYEDISAEKAKSAADNLLTPFSTLNCRTQPFQVFLDFAKNSKYTRKGDVHGRLYHHRILFDR